jgi:dipeptidyl aminopeptidase/acylaminoacyl peptidase
MFHTLRATLGFAPAVAAALILTMTTPTTSSAQDGLPPLLDRALFFGDPEISGSQISPDGQYLSFIRPLDGTRNVWVKKVDEPFDTARPITNDQRRPIQGYFWSRDSRYVLFVQDQGGDENFNVYAVDPAAPNAPDQPVPAARNLTDAEGARAVIYSVPRNRPDVLYVGLNDRDAAWHDVYRVAIATGERTLLRENTERVAAWVFDTEGALRLAVRTTDAGDTDILRVDESGFTPIYSCSVFETCAPVRFRKDGRKVYQVTNKGNVDLMGLTLLDVATGQEELIESDPEGRVDIENAMFSDVTGDLIATVYDDERTRYRFHDEAFRSDYEFLAGRFPERDISFQSSTADERQWIIVVTSDTDPGQVLLFDRKDRALVPQYTVRDKIPREHLAPMTAITYRSSDGLEVPAFLTLPKGVAPKNLPLLVFPHGGPWARDSWGYSAYPQFFANRGYAVLQPNFRGSTGYGKKFLNLGNGKWGETMQDDITWGVKHLVTEGVVDPKRVGIMGGSYGGYATLAGLAFTPDVYAAGVSIVGPSNLITLLDSIPPYWESVRTIFNVRIADPTTPEGKAQLERQSPLNSAGKITSPLLVVQGANDPRVKQAESDQIVIALREHGLPVEYIVAPDEGHGFARPVNNMAMIAASERFLAKHLGGRHQAEMPDDVATRLREITVDPKSVTLTTAVDPSAVGTPAPAADLAAGTAAYDASVDMGGQTMSMSIRQEVSEVDGAWVVSEQVETPMGPMSDETVIDKGSLLTRKRSVKQGPVDLSIAFADGRATGTMAMGGQGKPVDVDLGGPVFADGAGAHQVIARLPLAEGYTTAYRNFDLQSQKVKVLELRVVGSESVTVPAGTFDAWKVEVTSASDGASQTMWVVKDDRRVAKTRSVVPAMNGAIITTELR